MKWSLLILTQPSRVDFLSRLLEVLEPQIKGYQDIELAVKTNDTSISLGENRQDLLDSANGSYVNFIDDDDLVAEDYVEQIYPNLSSVDYIGFQLQLYIDGNPQKPTYHSLEYDSWWEDNKGYYRDLSHLNPIRKDLASTVKLSGGDGEDSRWASALRAKKIIKTQHYVDSIMYHYYFRTNKIDGVI
jgi:hypothetical protein